MESGQSCFDSSKVRQFRKRRGLFNMLDHTILADDEDGAGGDITGAREVRKHDLVGPDHRFVEIAQQGNLDFAWRAHASWACGMSTLMP